MLQALLTDIAESLLMAAGRAILKFLGWEQAFEFVSAVFGLSCIVAGLVMLWQGYL
jgi:hypothetical protein